MSITFDYLIERLEKECTHSSGYLGVEIDNIEDVTEEEQIDTLFFRIYREIDYLSESGHEETKEYGNDKAFISEYFVDLHIKRLEKFLNKYGEIFKEQQDQKEIEQIIEEVEDFKRNIDDSKDPDFHEVHYTDGGADLYVIHRIEGFNDDIEIMFGEHEYIRVARNRNNNVDDLIEIFNSLNDLEDQFDYSNVVAWKDEYGNVFHREGA